MSFQCVTNCLVISKISDALCYTYYVDYNNFCVYIIESLLYLDDPFHI